MKTRKQEDEKRRQILCELQNECRQILEENILKFWLYKMQDNEHGGWYGQMKGDGSVVKTANKGGILNARLLWTFSAAYRLTGKSVYFEAAKRCNEYILSHFIDKEYGGIYWELDYEGNPVNTKKQFYALGFMLYGLSEYVRATGNKESLDCALKLFHCIESHSLDTLNGGYIEACKRDWSEMNDMRLSEKDENYPKSQNTHLHIIEPYANLYRVCPTPSVADALRRLINLFTEKILNPTTHHLDLFFSMDWKRMGQLESYGHDIECSWLLHEAALVLNDEALLKKVEPVVRMVAQASEKGLQADGSMCYEANVETGYFCEERHWWVQAETVVGFFNIFEHFGDEDSLSKSLRCFNYIKKHLIDYEGGEWWWSCDAQGHINREEDKAGFWKCPYHNGRMCMELMERINSMNCEK